MAAVILSGTAITFSVTPGAGGFPDSASFVSMAVMIGGVQVWEDAAQIPWATALTDGVEFPAEASVIAEVNAFALYVIRFYDDLGTPLSPAQVFNEVIIESEDLLRPLENSFATWGELSLTARSMVGLRDYSYATESEQKAALINAYHTIGEVSVDFLSYSLRDVTAKSTKELDADSWAMLSNQQKEKLIRAQLIEANFLLSGNTPEKQRLSGLLSHSAGESTHFYRTSKPLELPVSRATALAMKGIITYAFRIS